MTTAIVLYDIDAYNEMRTWQVGALAGRTPGQILARLQQVALEFCQGKVHDDITMLALRVGEPPGRP